MKLQFPYSKYVLDNGLTLILHRDASVPLIVMNVLYKVGSSYEGGRKTGLAHLFEHLMFEGSANVPRGMHLKHIQDVGGSLNGDTSFDRTHYYEKLPSNYIELPFWLESDRMGFLLDSISIDSLENEKNIVRNERLETYDNRPYGLVLEKILSSFFPKGHPYSWPVIGFEKDILSYSIEDVQNFYLDYYCPSNASIVVAGAFSDKRVLNLAEKYFSPIQKSRNIINHPFAEDFELEANIEIEYSDNVALERVYLVWKGPCDYSPEVLPATLLEQILTHSINGRLYKNLVYEKQNTQDVSFSLLSLRLTGMFVIAATARPGVSVEEIEKEILAELNNISKSGSVTESELERVKASGHSDYLFGSQHLESIARRMNKYNDYYGEPDYFETHLQSFLSVQSEDVEKIASKYFSKKYLKLVVRQLKKN